MSNPNTPAASQSLRLIRWIGWIALAAGTVFLARNFSTGAEFSAFRALGEDQRKIMVHGFDF